MELLEEKQKMLVKYLREKDEYTAKICYDKNGKAFAHLEKTKGRIIGCIVAINNTVIGWSLINKKDRKWCWDIKVQSEIFKKDKELAFHIAYNRAMHADTLSQEELEWYYNKMPNSIEQEIVRMGERAELYFK
jgi:hypothetical protein